MSYILITNDDGVHAPGILALTQAMKKFGEVQVIAPKFNQSAGGHKKTLFTNIPFEKTHMADGTEALSISGSPADCIALSALGAMPWPPRLIVSGINRGSNMGQDVTYSGTVSAALEGSLHGIRAIAFSLDDHNANSVEDYQIAAQVAQQVVEWVFRREFPLHTILNVNIPSGDKLKGLRVTRQGIREYLYALEQDGDVYRIVGDPPAGRLDEVGTDLWAVHNQYVSLTPIHLDLTAHHFMAELFAWDIGL